MMTTRLFVLACVLALTTASMDQQASLAAKSRLAAAKTLAKEQSDSRQELSARSEQLAKRKLFSHVFSPSPPAPDYREMTSRASFRVHFDPSVHTTPDALPRSVFSGRI